MSMHMHLVDTKGCACTLHCEYRAPLNAGYMDQQITKAHLNIAHNIKRYEPQSPYRRMVDTIAGRKSENFYEENSNRFMTEVDDHAEKCE